jgi:hypothetical protein
MSRDGQRQQVERKRKSRTFLIAFPKVIENSTDCRRECRKGSSYLRHQVNFVNFEIEFRVAPRKVKKSVRVESLVSSGDGNSHYCTRQSKHTEAIPSTN